MEERFGHDFSRVRVHTDAEAAESAQILNARAYTVGRDVVFAAGEYAPHDDLGRRLLAHELTHVVQQSSGAGTGVPGAQEAEAERNADRVADGGIAVVRTPAAPGALQRQAPTPDRKTAEEIVALAKDASKDIGVRAESVVQKIISTYYPSDAAKVKAVVFDDKLGAGLETEPVRDPSTKVWFGKIHVSEDFVNKTTGREFARRVVQVGHELEHIDQYRQPGLGVDPGKKDEREFLAFYHEALAAEKPGTGRIAHSMRIDLIDTALGYFYCLASADQKTHEDKKDELLTERKDQLETIKKKRFTYTPHPAPTACTRPAYDVRKKP
jgi:hypothetical protein